MLKHLLFLLVPLLLISCKNTEEFAGFSYDPPGVTNTTDKEVNPQPRRTIGAGSPKIWVNNEFNGARLSDFYALNDSTFEAFIEPENTPINNSPWFAFKIWSDSTQRIKLKLNYHNARHRYIPKIIKKTGSAWVKKEEAAFAYDSTDHSALITLEVSPDTTLLSAQSPFTTDSLKKELHARGLSDTSFVSRKKIGTSKQRKPLYEIQITSVDSQSTAPVLVVLSRQHPPELSGFRASLFIMEELASNSELAQEFRNTFVTKAYPIVNPDGVDNGHWRHNAGGVDLNRDWENFNQPETRAIRNALLPLKENPLRQVYYAIDFHSTNENIFYPINKEIKTVPDNFTQKWTQQIINDNPEIVFSTEEFDTSSPISKNWFYHTFGADALTFELHDEMSEEDIEEVSRSAARSLMRMLLNEWNKKKS